MVQRYSAYANNTHAYEDVDGVFVKYEDYTALKEERDDLIEQLKTLAKAYAKLTDKKK